MAFARTAIGNSGRNLPVATLIAYDLQAGSYVAGTRANPEAKRRWCDWIAEFIRPLLPAGGRLLEVGVGEATTLSGVLTALDNQVGESFGFDLSWSRVAEGQLWLKAHDQQADLFVADLFHIPFADNSIDVVYTSHSLEPNRGREQAAIAECLRVARDAVVLIEPRYELASPEAQARMDYHGYVRGLRDAAEALGAHIEDDRLLENAENSLNPSGLLLLRKSSANVPELRKIEFTPDSGPWRCPLTGSPLVRGDDLFFASDVGIAYPVMRGVPLLRPEHAVVASRIELMG